MSRSSSVPLKYPYFPPNQDPKQFGKDDYKNHPLLHYSLAKEKRKEVQKLVQMQADRNRAKVLERLEKRKQRSTKEKKKASTPKLTQEECLVSLRKFVGMAPIAGIQKQTLVNITKLLPAHQKSRYPAALANLLEEVKRHYLENLREGTINMMIRNPELEEIQAQAIKRKVKDKEAPWHKEFKKNQRRILINLHVLHPALRQCLSICKDHLNTTTLANCTGFRGDAIDLDSFCGNIISECEKTEETLMNTWFPKITAVFTDKRTVIQHKGERLSRFYKCASSLVSIQLRNLLTRSILGYVDVFGDRRKLPRIEMELILQGNELCFSPTMQEVCDMIVSVVYEMNKLLREVPTIESWISDVSSEFVQVSLHKDFIQAALEKLRASINTWLLEPQEFCDAIVKRFDFLIDGTARRAIDKFISTDPKFEDICNELQVYNRYVEQTQEITSLEYFTFIRLDCEKVRKGLGDAARDLANSLLQNVVDTYRKENETICAAFEEIERIALNAPKSTKEMIELGEYMLHVKNKRMLQLTDEIENSKKHLLYIIDVHIFSQEDIVLNTKTLGWPVKIRPVFEQNTEIVEDCKARFEDNLQKKSEWTSKELEKLSLRVQELEELGEIANVQQYTYEVRMVQNKLKQIEDTICWINQEEALFKFPQSSYPDVGDMNTIQSGEGKMKSNIDPYARLFTTVLKWQKAEKKWTDGSFLELNAEQIEADINAFSKEMVELQKLFKSKFKQQALDGDSKYAKMNLEDSNPDNLPPPLRICALTIEQIKEFRTNIPIIVCLCNPGIRQRHWNQMSDVIGFDITPNSGSSLRKVLRLELNEFMEKLEAISIAATREHALELTLEDMKNEWAQVNFKLLPYRDTDYKILDSVEAIQDHLDDHLLKTQIMRGSPYFKAFEIEVKQWELQLGHVQAVLSLCQRVQEHWLYLEPIYTTEDIAAQMQTESRLFKDVDTSWKTIMEMVESNPNVFHITESNGVLDMLKKSDDTVRDILKGLDKYLNKKCMDFSRLFFLSRQEVLGLISETRDPTRAVKLLRLCFSGIYSLEFDELQEIQSMCSLKGERIPFPAPIRTRDARGCVEKWLIQIEENMKTAVRDIIDGALETVGSSTRPEWVQEWPCQAVLVAAFLDATAQSQEAIKGGTGALKDLESKYLKYNEELTEMIEDNLDTSVQEVLASMMIHDMYTRETINALIKDQVVSEKDFSWRSRPKCYLTEGDVFVEMLVVREKYLYEYLGDCSHQVWDRSFEKSMYTFLTAFSMKQFPWLKGPTASGKHVLVHEVSRILAQNLVVKSITPMTSPTQIIQYFKGCAFSGSWLCCSTLDRLAQDQLSTLVPWMQAIAETLKRIRKKKSSGKAHLPNGETLVVSAKSFLCFTSSPLYKGRYNLPPNMNEFVRPISLVNPNKTPILRSLLEALGINGQLIAENMVEFSSTCELVLSTIKKLDMRQLVSIIVNMRRIKNEVEESDAAILRGLFEQSMKGTLPARDWYMSEELNKEMLGADSYNKKEDEAIRNFLEEEKANLNIVVHDKLVSKTSSFLESVSTMRATALCGPSFSGKSMIIEASLSYEKKVKNQAIEQVRIHPKTCSHCELFGWFSNDGYSKWNDGILTKHLREEDSEKQQWLICDGSVDYKWAENIESFMTSGVLTVYSGEELTVSPNTKIIFETNHLKDVSPAFISKCGIVLTELNELSWTAFFENWCRRTTDDQQVMRWRRGQEELINGLFQWLVPPLLHLVRYKCNSVISPMPNALASYMIEFFTSTLSEAIGNLKERKYLRSWIQAACVTSATWTIGGILADKDRSKFDSKLRDILMGRSTDDPLPAILNNKFDALPPAEGLVYDFVFDFKARGQWKHWNDVVKNMDNPEVLTPLTVIPTIDTARFYHVYALSVRCKKPMILIGPPGIGKSMAIWSKIKSNEKATCYKFTALPNTTTQELKTWLVEKLYKRKKATYGPQTATGTVFIDDLTSTHPDEFGEVAMHEQIIELIDTATWMDIKAGCMKCTLEDIELVFAATLESGIRNVLSDRLLSRMNFTIMAHPSEESFVKIFSTTLSLTFKDQNFPPEVSGVIPSIIQSTYKVYTECRRVLLEDRPVNDRAHIPDLRDVQRIIRGCSALPKEAAENKKLFTRLWVHESLRNFFDRLTMDKDMDDVYQCMRTCVRTIFRENFDSAFEHLGKVDGQVTLLNLRNLLFGRYVLPEDKTNPFVEVTGFDQVEKVVTSKIKDHNESKGREDLSIIPIRYSLEMVSHIHRIISTEGGHGVIGGYGGDGRRTMAKISALLNDHIYFNLPVGHHYNRDQWRVDLKGLIEKAGSEDQDVVIVIPISQMLKHSFLRSDIDSLFARGEIPDLFSQEEKHQLNEVVHKHLMKQEGGKLSEKTPAELYEIFVEISRVKIHVLLTYNYDEEPAKKLLRQHKSILTAATIINLRRWPDDALRKFAETIFEEVNADRTAKKTVMQIGIDIYEKAIELSEGDACISKIRVSPAMYTQYVTTLSKTYVHLFGKIEDRRNRLERVLHKLENISGQVDELQQELSDLQPRFEQINKEIDSKKESMTSLLAQRTAGLTAHKQMETKVMSLKSSLDKVKRDYDDKIGEDRDKVEAINAALMAFKPADITLIKTLKAPPSCVKLAFAGMCTILGIQPEKIPDPQAKKNRKEKKTEISDGSDYWVPAKKYVGEGVFPEKLCTMDLSEITTDKIDLVNANVLTNPEWDPAGAGKVLPLAEVLAKWIVAVKDYVTKRNTILELCDQLKEFTENYESENKIAMEKLQALDKDEQALEQLKEDLEKMEHERSQINHDKIACKDKLEKGRKLMDELNGESQTWKKDLSMISEDLEHLLGNVLIYAASICLLPIFHSEKRKTLKAFMMSNLKEHEIAYTTEEIEDMTSLLIDRTAIEQWRLAGLPSDTFFTENAIAIQNSSKWPLILDPEGRALHWLRTLYKDKTIRILQEFGETSELMEIMEKSISGGEILILYDDACAFDSRLDILYRRCYVQTGEDQPTPAADEIDIGDQRISCNPGFKLFIISRESVDLDLQTRCCMVNYDFTDEALNEFFLDTVFEREKPAKRQEYLLVCGREIEAMSSSKRHRERIQVLLSDTEGNVLDNANLTTSLLEMRKELGKSDDRVSGMRDMKKDMRTSSLQYLSAAKHATILYMTVLKLVRVNPMYQYSFDWFTQVFRSSIENSNKSNNIDKRLRYLKDHLTYSLFCQVSYSLQQDDCLLFAFLLCCQLMIAEARVPIEGLEMLIKLWRIVTKEDLSAPTKEPPSEKYGTVPEILDWMPQKKWEFINTYAEQFPEMRGFSADLVDSAPRWKLLHEAKEPDNLPLHEPWYSRLSRFHKLVVVAVIRVDKLLELVHSFVSDHIGYKFVEPVQFDLGRIFSECDSSQPIVYTIDGPSEAKTDIRKFSKEREKDLLQLSMGSEDNINEVAGIIEKNIETGEQWILLENFQNAKDIRSLLRPHITIDQDFHHGYRLWIVTAPTPKFPTPELKKCSKLTWQDANSIRESILEAFTKGCIKEAKCWSSDRQSIGGNERHMSRLLYCLAFFHASLNERCRYGPIGGWSNFPMFARDELTLGVSFLEMIAREFDSINYEGLIELLSDCAYVNSFTDLHDRALLNTILNNCINEKAVTSNRYRFSVAVNDFFVPNKTLYKDYIEFIKGLPGKSDNEVFDLDCSCQILNDSRDATQFLFKLYYAISASHPFNSSDVVAMSQYLLDCVNEALKAHDSIPFLSDGPFKWLWINEMTRHDIILSSAFADLDRLNKCAKGKKVLDNDSERLLSHLEKGRVPRTWMSEDKTLRSLRVSNFVRIVKERVALYKGLNTTEILPLDLIMRPVRLLTAIRFNYKRQNSVRLSDVRLQATFYETLEDMEKARSEGEFGFRKLVLLGAKWDFEQQILVEKKMMHEYASQLPYALFTPKDEEAGEDLVNCPFYVNYERSSTSKSSSFLCYIPMASSIPQDLLFKKGIMLTIDDTDDDDKL